MKFVKIKDGVEWKGYLAVHETISGYECFICNDDPFTRIALTEEHLKDYQLGIPKNYHLIYKTQEAAEEMLQRIAKLNGFTKID
jgi:hypothetical protein